MSNEPRLKPNKRYIFYRVYWIFVFVLWNGMAFLKDFNLSPIYILLMFPLVVPAIHLTFSLLAIPFKYSVFGPYERTPFPQEEPLLKQRGAGGVGWFLYNPLNPIFNWYIFNSGLGVSILGLGKVFIPAEQIVSMQQDFLYNYKLIHKSPEVRNPIGLPITIFEAVQNLVKRQGNL